MKKDINHHQAIFENWKERVKAEGIQNISPTNAKYLLAYITDMETGENVGQRTKKGTRSFGRLNVLRKKLIQIFQMFEKEGIKDISSLKNKVTFLHQWTNDLYKGKIKRIDGEPYESPVEFVRTLKAFWHWYMKVNRKLYHQTNGKKGKIIDDITEDLLVKANETKFVYFTKEQLDKMLPYFSEDEQVLCLFLFDTIIRFPTEVSSLKVKDVYQKEGDMWLNIPDDISKVIGRNFNLLYSGDALKKYITRNGLQQNDDLFPIIKEYNKIYLFNKKLKQIAVQVFGDVVSHPTAQNKFSQISGYDFRHSGTIHLRCLSNKTGKISLDAIRQRGGWTDFKMLNYYTKFLGLTGEIKKEALLIEEDKTRLENELDDLKKKHSTMKHDVGKSIDEIRKVVLAMKEAHEKHPNTKIKNLKIKI